MTSRPTRGADLLVSVLAAAGCRHLFCLSGNQIMSVFDAALESPLRLIHTRHEAAAVHMADAWGRLTGQPGIALVTAAPGFANALGALYTATMAESPLVLLSGDSPQSADGMGAFQEMQQAAISRPLVKGSWRATEAYQLPRLLAQAMAIAAGGRPGPVHLALPADVLNQPCGLVAAATGPDHTAGVPAFDHSALAAVLQEARRPLILLGPAAGRRCDAALLERCAGAGLPVAIMESPRGLADPALGALAAVLPEADALVLIGKRLDFTLDSGAPFKAAVPVVQIDPEPAELRRAARNAASHGLRHSSLVGELPVALATLDGLASARSDGRREWSAQVAEAIAYRPPEWAHKAGADGALHPLQVLRPLQRILARREAVFVGDGGEFGQWAQACMATPRRVINGPAGSIGSAIPFALAAQLAFPTATVVAVVGDGTFGFHAMELDTAIRYGLPVAVLVGNDAAWNAEYQIQLRDYGTDRLIGCELRPSSYDAVARGLGARGFEVATTGQAEPTLRSALDGTSAAVVNVRLARTAAPHPRLYSWGVSG